MRPGEKFLGIVKSFYVKVLGALFWVLLIFALDSIGVAIATLLSVIIHELGHLLAARYLSARGRIKNDMQGLKISFSRQFSYREELFVALGGPCINIAVFLFTFALPLSFMKIFGLVNLFAGISNLIPVSGYDGERILSAVLCPVLGAMCTERIIFYLSGIASVILAFFSLYLSAKVGAGFWIYFIFLWVFLSGIKRDGKIFFERKQEKTREITRKRKICERKN